MAEEVADDKWWESFHVVEMADLFLQRRSQTERDNTSRFLLEQLHLQCGDLVYDQCCGIGSVSLDLAKRGVSVIGADLCPPYIERGQQKAKTTGSDCQFVCEDAYSFVTKKPCDAAFNWYSSFGYASSDPTNLEMLHRAFESLRPGGYFAIDVPNFPFLIRNFQRHLVRTGTSDGKAVVCIRECQMDLYHGFLNQTWTWIVEGRTKQPRLSRLKIYLPHQINEMLQQAGFQHVKLMGDIDRAELDIDSPRLIAIARKPQ